MMIVLMIQAIFLASLYVDQAYSQGTLMINCGGGGDGMWESDDNFIKTGQNSQEKYLIQAGFFYGSYDGKFTPPTFDLQFDGNHWATVYTTRESPSFKEAIVFAKRENISVCVARTLAYNQIPFISTLVLVYLPSSLPYKRIGGGYYRLGRMNMKQVMNRRFCRFPGDIYSRLWFLGVSPFYKYVTAPEPRNLGGLEDQPPSSVMTSTIEAPNPSESMIFCFILDEKNRLVYVNLYFTEAKASRKKRMFDVYINGENMNLDLFLQYEMGTEISLSLVTMTSLFNLTLTPREGSTLPPTISGMELFSVIEELASGTSNDDVQGLEQLISNWKSLKGWTGDPCLPSYSAWDWISCDDNNPPRVLSLNLGSHGLEGQIIDFSQMQILEVIGFTTH
ncbi:probable LRR receptor-like serine/threonine-protein kinase At1g05700 [Aristolochia californica]|uniref:probable LRR receptor-like serine/threonine-protein kinase At1g05700 n=1 Tax=Aristolochia californica TaxID=171875 RepID=UPI0035D744FE